MDFNLKDKINIHEFILLEAEFKRIFKTFSPLLYINKPSVIFKAATLVDIPS